MKRLNLITPFLAACYGCLLAACTPQSITIEGKVKNTTNHPIVYRATYDGIYKVYTTDTLRVQPDSTFKISLPAAGKEKISFFLWGAKALGSVYLKPGTVQMNIDVSLDQALATPKNEMVEENEFLKELDALDEKVWNLRKNQEDAFGISKDTIALSVYNKLIKYAYNLEKRMPLKDSVFRSKALQDLRIQLLLAFEDQYLSTFYRASGPTIQTWQQVFPKMLNFVRINHPDNVFSPAFADAISIMAGIHSFMEEKKQAGNSNETNQIKFEKYIEELQGRVQEVALANIFLQDAAEEQYASDIPELYDRFRQLYPHSLLMPAVNQAVEKNKAFNRTPLSEDIHILSTDSIRSFKEITDKYSGKTIFIDIWATWCHPCREAFAYVKPLQAYAQKQDIVLLYVSIDKAANAGLWKKMIAHYQLKGEHVLINDAFKMDIYNTFGKKGVLAIPHYAIINKKGEIQFLQAESPENIDKLTAQLQAAAE